MSRDAILTDLGVLPPQTPTFLDSGLFSATTRQDTSTPCDDKGKRPRCNALCAGGDRLLIEKLHSSYRRQKRLRNFQSGAFPAQLRSDAVLAALPLAFLLYLETALNFRDGKKRAKSHRIKSCGGQIKESVLESTKRDLPSHYCDR